MLSTGVDVLRFQLEDVEFQGRADGFVSNIGLPAYQRVNAVGSDDEPRTDLLCPSHLQAGLGDGISGRRTLQHLDRCRQTIAGSFDFGEPLLPSNGNSSAIELGLKLRFERTLRQNTGIGKRSRPRSNVQLASGLLLVVKYDSLQLLGGTKAVDADSGVHQNRQTRLMQRRSVTPCRRAPCLVDELYRHALLM